MWEILLQPPPTHDHLTAEELRARNILGRLIFGKGLFWYENLLFCSILLIFSLSYSISMLPRSLQWLIELIGFTSDRQKGLEDLLSATKITPSPRG